jgi:hypothetical protein
MDPKDKKRLRTLERFAKGECPRCSRADFEILIKAVGHVLQLESANGADTSSGYVLTSLRSDAESRAAVHKWLAANLLRDQPFSPEATK